MCKLLELMQTGLAGGCGPSPILLKPPAAGGWKPRTGASSFFTYHGEVAALPPGSAFAPAPRAAHAVDDFSSIELVVIEATDRSAHVLGSSGAAFPCPRAAARPMLAAASPVAGDMPAKCQSPRRNRSTRCIRAARPRSADDVSMSGPSCTLTIWTKRIRSARPRSVGDGASRSGLRLRLARTISACAGRGRNQGLARASDRVRPLV